VLEDVGYQDLTPTERAVVAGVALVELLLRGTEPVRDVLNDHREALPEGWRAVQETAVQYWEQTYRPLPLEVIRADLQAAEDREGLGKAWQQLHDELTPLAQANFHYTAGAPTRNELYRRDRPLGRLQQFVLARDTDGVAGLLHEEKENLADLGQFLDQATRAADSTLALIVGAGRQSFLVKLRAIVKAAKEIARYSRSAPAEGDADWVGAANRLARVIHQRWQALDQEAVAIAGPEGLLLIRALRELGKVKEWGGDDVSAT
jgi:choline dehydrogenase-like flavoprotein